jgi:TolB-like protein
VAALTLLAAAPAAAKDLRVVAVLPMVKGAGGPELDGFGAALADMMVTDLSTVAGLQLVERSRLHEIVAELELGESAFIDPASAQKLGSGLGAELVVMGSFSVVKDTMVIDTRLVAVATGAIVKAARSEGEVGDFVSIEKDVIEKLVDGLEIELSRAERRQLLLQAPTEDFEAFANYGRGVKAKDDGRLDEAKAAFEAAIQKDPEFDLAASELAQLAALVRREREKETIRYKDARERSLYEGLAALTPETDRPKSFRDTQRSMMEMELRIALLRSAGRHCTRFDEMKHYLLRNDGELDPWFDGLPGAEHYDRYRAAADLLDLRAEELGLRGPETHYGSRPGDAMQAVGTVMWSGKSLFIYGNMQPEKFRATIIGSMEQCFPPDERAAQWAELHKAAKTFAWYRQPLYITHGVGPSTLTPEDSMDLYGALLRAESTGVDRKVTTITERVLARHPEGDRGRREVLSRIQAVVNAGERTESRLMSRHGMSPDALEGAVKAVRDKSRELLRMDNPVCAQLVERKSGQAERTLERYERDRNNSDVRRAQDAANQLGSLVATLVLARCFTGSKRKPMTVQEAYPTIRKALLRRHPAKLDDDRCNELVGKLEEGTRAEAEEQLLALPVTAQAAQLDVWLGLLHRGSTSRCLSP